MEEHDSAADKTDGTAVDQLNFGAKTAKRVGWEAWEFAVEAPHLVRVTNTSYGFEKDDHSYLVGVEDRDGLLIPSECECPADKYNEEYACKHRVCLSTVGGPTVLEAAEDFENPSPASSEDRSKTMADKLRADGGHRDQQEGDECACTPDFPCADCFIDGKRGLPE